MSKPNSLVERMKYLQDTGDGADVHFLVGEGDEEELFPAHKAILLAASDVFAAMFRHDARNAKPAAVGTAKEVEPVPVPDVEAGAFRAMLSFIYADDLRGLNGDNAVAVLCAADKYNVSGLIKACVHFPIGKLSNVFVAFDKACFHGKEDFARRCMDYIDVNAQTLIQSTNFLQIDQKLLYEILDRDQLMIDEELTIWNAALRWADEKCRQSGQALSAENRLAVLGPALFKIRFPLISQKDFSKIIVPSRMLTNDQMMSIFLHYSHPDADQPELYPLQFPTKRRTVTKSPGDDPYKPKGQIVMTIEKVSEFARMYGGTNHRFSEAVYIRGLPWRIYAGPQTQPGSAQKFLGFFLHAGITDPSWSCAGSATFKIVSQMEGKKDHALEETSRIFNSKCSWGCVYSMSFKQLMDPDNGWYDSKNDTVILAVDVTAEEPLGVK